MTIFRPLPRSLTRPLAYAVLVAWVVCMGLLVNRSYLQAQASNLATDLARYGPTAMWRGVYYRGEKIGFSVSQTVRTDEGFELQEDGRLQMLLLGQDSIAAIRTTARVDRDFQLSSFDFSLDPGTGAVQVQGALEPRPDGQFTLRVAITSSGATRTEERTLAERPALSLNMARQLASSGLTPGARHRWMVLDPATLQNAPMEFLVGRREVVRTSDGVVPAFRVDMTFAGLATTAWITDTGDVVREESPLGLITIRETPERAQALGIPGRVQRDLLQASAVVPVMPQRLDEPRDVRRLRLRLVGADLTSPDLDGVGQTVDGDVIEIRDPQGFQPGPGDPDAARYLAPEALIESDDPEIRAEAEKAMQGVTGGVRERAEALTRYVNALLEKKPTISLPSAREVLRTKVGDCNEHTALYVAMARALGIPARISVGLVFVRGAQGAFYYHAWPEVYIDAGGGRGYWLPVDPTFNQFPADSTHLRLARGGLDKQAAILPLIGRLQMTVLEMDVIPTSAAAVATTPQQGTFAPLPVAVPRRNTAGCECEDY